MASISSFLVTSKLCNLLIAEPHKTEAPLSRTMYLISCSECDALRGTNTAFSLQAASMLTTKDVLDLVKAAIFLDFTVAGSRTNAAVICAANRDDSNCRSP